MDKSTLTVIIVMVVMILAGGYIVLFSKKSRRQQKTTSVTFYKKAYTLLSGFFLTSNKLDKVYKRLAALSIYDINELREYSTKYYLISTAISAGVMVAALVLFNGDTVAILICLLFAVLVNNVLVDKQIDSTNLVVYKALSHTLSSMRQEYMRLGSVTEALDNCEVPAVLVKPFHEIHSILTANNGELRLHAFYESSPFRPLQTFAGICFNINSSGDEKDANGTSNFITALEMLTAEVNSEVQRLVTMKTRFGFIEYLPFLPVFGMRMLETYFVSIMPGTALIYNGMLGYGFRITTLLSCILAYTIISRVGSSVSIKEDDRGDWVVKILRHEAWDNFINNITPKNRRAEKVERQLGSSLSAMRIEHLYTKKVLFASVAFLLTIVATVSTIQMARDFLLTSTQQLSLVATDEMGGYTREQILSLDQAYLTREADWDDETAIATVKTYMPGLSDLQSLDQFKRLKDKEKSLNGAYFHWYYVFISFGACAIGWFGPNIGLIVRKLLAQTESEDDFLQLQTLMAILMNTDMDTLDTLWQLCQHSRIHKNALLHCYHSYPSNPEKALVRLQSKTNIIEFKRFVGKLQLTVSDLSLREAFGDLRTDRDHMLRLREISIESMINRKRALCGPLSLAPLALMVIGDLIVPLGVLGLSEFTNALSMM